MTGLPGPSRDGAIGELGCARSSPRHRSPSWAQPIAENGTMGHVADIDGGWIATVGAAAMMGRGRAKSSVLVYLMARRLA
jgi:hypothetical protein